MLADPGQFRLLFDAMLGPDPVARMRAADAVEKLTRRRPDLLWGLEGRLLSEVAAIEPKGGPLAPRPAAAPPCPHRAAATQAVAILQGFLDDDSRIVRTFAMQAWPTWPKLIRGCVAGSCRCWPS